MSQLQTVSNALDILEELGRAERHLSAEDLSEILELPIGTMYRLLQTLESRGFIERYSRKEIGLGFNFLSLAKNFNDRIEKQLIMVAQPYMEKIKNISQETCILSIRSNLNSQCIKSVSSDYIIRFVAEDNRLLKLFVGASSRSILAFEGERLINLVMDTLADEAKREWLADDLEKIRKQGYSISCNEYDKSSVGIGVPIFNSHDRIYASLAIVGPDSRVEKEKWGDIINALKEGSAQITKKLKAAEGT